MPHLVTPTRVRTRVVTEAGAEETDFEPWGDAPPRRSVVMRPAGERARTEARPRYPDLPLPTPVVLRSSVIFSTLQGGFFHPAPEAPAKNPPSAKGAGWIFRRIWEGFSTRAEGASQTSTRRRSFKNSENSTFGLEITSFWLKKGYLA